MVTCFGLTLSSLRTTVTSVHRANCTTKRISQLLRNMKVCMVMKLPLRMLLWPEDSLMSNRNNVVIFNIISCFDGPDFLNHYIQHLQHAGATCTQDVQFAGHTRKLYSVRWLSVLLLWNFLQIMGLKALILIPFTDIAEFSYNEKIYLSVSYCFGRVRDGVGNIYIYLLQPSWKLH